MENLLGYLLQQSGIVVVMGVVMYKLWALYMKERTAKDETQTAFTAYMQKVNDDQLAMMAKEVEAKTTIIALLDQIIKNTAKK